MGDIDKKYEQEIITDQENLSIDKRKEGEHGRECRTLLALESDR
jgi:hypothetical protein